MTFDSLECVFISCQDFKKIIPDLAINAGKYKYRFDILNSFLILL